MSYRNNSLKGILQVPGDKSISHRALIFSALAKGESTVTGLSPAIDCLSSALCLGQLGIVVESDKILQNGRELPILRLKSPGPKGLVPAPVPLFAGNSGTTMRLLAGLLAGCDFRTTLDGDASLRLRPMGRVLKLLAEMGSSVEYLESENFAPFAITGGNLHGGDFKLDVASAQVQTALLLAGLQADGPTTVVLPGAVRNHTERMFGYLNVPFSIPEANTVKVTRLSEPIVPYAITVPGDISSAAFFMVAAACLPGSDIVLTNLVLNEGRALVIEILEQMGADICVSNRKEMCGEPVGDVAIRYCGRLKGVTINGGKLAAGIDEVPILSLAGALCDGEFMVRDASELRVKESDRIAAIVGNLRDSGADVEEFPDGFSIAGKKALRGGAVWKSLGDHRIAMTGVVAELLAENPLNIDDLSCIGVSYPHFQADLFKLSQS